MSSPTLPTVAAAILVPLVAYPVLKRLIRSYLLEKYTCVPDLEHLAAPRRGGKIAGTAVVCGGSVAGLFAARISATHFEKVVVIEPEAWTFTAEAREPPNFDTRPVQGNTGSYNTVNHKRSRVYQYSAVHLYQAILVKFARTLFPDFDTIAKSWNAIISSAPFKLSINGNIFEYLAGQDGLYAPRRLVEPLFRKLIYDSCPQIDFVHGTASAFQLAADGSISTVNVRLADGTSRDIRDVALAVDCTGIAQSGLKMLSRAIPTLPTNLRDTYNADIVYSTLEYPLPPNFNEDLKALNIPAASTETGIFGYTPSPDCDTRMVSLTRSDANHVVFTMGGWAVDMPTNLDEIRAFARQVKDKRHIPEYFYKVVDLIEPVAHLGTVFEARITNCYKVNYERAADKLPRNFVAMGDASMRVNPRFGQGVTKSAIGAMTLDNVLRRMTPSNRNFGKTFFKKIGPRTQGAWDGTRLSDYVAETTIPLPSETRQTGALIRWYQFRLVKILNKNTAAASAFYNNTMFLAPPLDLFTPRIVASVLWEAIRPSKN